MRRKVVERWWRSSIFGDRVRRVVRADQGVHRCCGVGGVSGYCGLECCEALRF